MAELSESVTALILNSELLSVISIVKFSLLLEPSLDVATTCICIELDVSKSNPFGSATVTTPVSASMANALFGLLDKL